ncbi:E3 ubiquitin/ISG15 ligase TRIM25-like [Engraulis encrasicolus]|uniref:E3 ubiquitin/ISG15 ligase TRIM25-like n=1 Tax=Engraulis encrasicolus TaxID=184585 RepID=UPI002FD30A23
MAALNDLYQCSVCLDTLKDPVTIPCGHNYCQSCISGCWNQAAQTGVYSCPQCRETFSQRPALKKNTVLTELIAQIKIAEDASAELCLAEPGDVECDFCTERKLKAVKSCLMCLASFCETHVQPHYKSPAFKKHDLIEASAHLQEKVCPNHGRLLEMFCRTDQTCICMLCATNDHRGHDMVSTAAGSQEKKITIGKVRKTSMEQTQEREKKLNQLKKALGSHQVK